MSVDFLQNQFMGFLDAGMIGNHLDAADRRSYQQGFTHQALVPGTRFQFILYIKKIQLRGTVDGTAFLNQRQNIDHTSTPRCLSRGSSNAFNTFQLYLDYSIYFANLSSSTDATVETTFNSNQNREDILKENECFIL